MSSSYFRQEKTILPAVLCGSSKPLVATRLLVCLILLGTPALAPAQTRETPATGNTVRSQAFVSFQNERGEITCREATSDERSKSAVRSGGGSMRVIYSGAPRQQDMP